MKQSFFFLSISIAIIKKFLLHKFVNLGWDDELKISGRWCFSIAIQNLIVIQLWLNGIQMNHTTIYHRRPDWNDQTI